MKDKNGFYSTISGYLKKGVMRLIYSSDELAVLVVTDTFYIASDYTVSGEGYVAFLVNSKMVRAMLVDPSFLERLMTTSDQATLSQMMFRLTDSTFRKFTKSKIHDPKDELVYKFVDPDLEQWIVQTYGTPPSSVVPEQEKTGFFRTFFKKHDK